MYPTRPAISKLYKYAHYPQLESCAFIVRETYVISFSLVDLTSKDIDLFTFNLIMGPPETLISSSLELSAILLIRLPARANVVRKTRYLLDYIDLVLEVDVYHGKHEGLITLEFEFQSIEQAELFELPGWIDPAIDVTDDPRFKNKELSRSRKTPDLQLLK